MSQLEVDSPRKNTKNTQKTKNTKKFVIDYSLFMNVYVYHWTTSAFFITLFQQPTIELTVHQDIRVPSGLNVCLIMIIIYFTISSFYSMDVILNPLWLDSMDINNPPLWTPSAGTYSLPYSTSFICGKSVHGWKLNTSASLCSPVNHNVILRSVLCTSMAFLFNQTAIFCSI